MGLSYSDIQNTPYSVLKQLYITHSWINNESNKKQKPNGVNVLNFKEPQGLQFKKKKDR